MKLMDLIRKRFGLSDYARVLTKVRGPEIQIGSLLDRDNENSFEVIFDKYAELSDFAKCRKVIEQKKKELEAYGYCI